MVDIPWLELEQWLRYRSGARFLGIVGEVQS